MYRLTPDELRAESGQKRSLTVKSSQPEEQLLSSEDDESEHSALIGVMALTSRSKLVTGVSETAISFSLCCIDSFENEVARLLSLPQSTFFEFMASKVFLKICIILWFVASRASARDTLSKN